MYLPIYLKSSKTQSNYLNINMTQEDKELLLKDLSMRLPYAVKGKVYAEVSDGKYDIIGDLIFYDAPFTVVLNSIDIDNEIIRVTAIGNEDTVEFIDIQQTDGEPYTIEEFTPYLRPLESISEKEKKEILSILEIGGDIYDNGDIELGCEYDILTLSTFKRYITELNKRMFDVCHLIDKKLALEAPEGMYN